MLAKKIQISILMAFLILSAPLAHVKSMCDCSHKVNKHKGSIFR